MQQKQQKTNIIDIIFVMDKSGSMSALTEETIFGFNELISKQRQQNSNDTVFVSTILFNHDVQELHNRVLLEEVEPMTNQTYHAIGSTALYDAVGYAISKADQTHAKLTQKPNKVLMVITTDGYENASREYNHAQIKKLIGSKREQNWDFMFMGANIEVKDFAEHIGISRSSACSFSASHAGMHSMYKTVDAFILNKRKK